MVINDENKMKKYDLNYYFLMKTRIKKLIESLNVN
jgi:hypothetical protein